MAVMDDINGFMDFLYDYIYEMKATKSSEYKLGKADGLQEAYDMLRDYVIDYPEFVDPNHKNDKFKL